MEPTTSSPTRTRARWTRCTTARTVRHLSTIAPGARVAPAPALR
jgi:hypothetical protein